MFPLNYSPPHFFHFCFVRVSMMATESTSGVQGYPLWDKDEENVMYTRWRKRWNGGFSSTTDENPGNPKGLV